jgi:hypothetical protein
MKPIYFPGKRDHSNPRSGCTVVGEDLIITFGEDGDFSCNHPSAFDPKLSHQSVHKLDVIQTKVIVEKKDVDLKLKVKGKDEIVHLKIHKDCKNPHDPID